MSMFQKSIINSVKQDESKVALRWASFQKFLEKVEYIKTVKEEKYQDGFLVDIFENCLGYTLDMTNPKSFNLEREKKNETDGKKADGVIYVDEKVVGVIELKAQDTKNLDKIETQAFNYHASHSNSKYIIISNFDELRFYVDKKTAYEKFNLFTLNYEEFKKLHLLISYESIKDDVPLKLKEKTNSFEQDISKKLYKDFSNFRTLLFENIVKNNYDESKTLIVQKFDKQTLLRLTQKLCDRIIFILFAEDRDLLRANMIKEIREEFINQKFTNYSLYDIYKFYFDAINKGNDKLQIPQYNGGLFAVDELLDSLIIDDFILDDNVQILSNYDFASEISVNILGHIFEQSLTDLEELQANIENINFDKTKSKRKKDGVFYTPEYITRYIVENTLGKMCQDKREELQIGSETLVSPSNPKKLTKQEQQTKDNLQEYKKWLLNLKILDPACGSGAFLNQALEYLISEHKNLQNDLALMGDLFASYMVEEEILEHNLYGVDINEDAVEIAKLSLWLRTAKRGRPLTKLVDKIKCGNSLIDDKNVVANAFVWEEEFKEVFEQGGFDVVIGNPPYVFARENISQFEKNYYVNLYNSAKYQINTYLLFMEKSIKLIKNNGFYGLIVPNAWLMIYSGEDLRKYILETSNINKIINLSGYSFENVNVETIILLAKKENIVKNEFQVLLSKDTEFIFSHNKKQEDFIKNSGFEFRVFSDDKSSSLIEKLQKNSVILDEIVQIKAGLKAYEKGKGNPKQSEEDVKNRIYDYNYKFDENTYKYLDGKDVGRYFISWNGLFLKYGDILAAPRTFDLFSSEKIIIREITGKYPKSIISTYSDEIYLFNMSNISINKKLNKSIDLKYITVVLNSSLMSYYFINNTAKAVRQMFPKIILQDLRQFPFKEISLKEQEPFIKKADLMLELNKKLQELKQNFINELNLEKVPTKLQKFEELDFDDFVKEYAKAKKLKFADRLEERTFKNEWQRLFENDKKEVLEIQNQINITDKEIDQMVYKLYDLTPDEIKIVESD
ncbi:Eco57I restriction-modification methylase domain-containing protein [Aliarcobacter cryaerophilus]|uniref:Eco57I restriction-modification methylase domain-containing protein n=1 Tax=Aliarcobacter cryaerophilus TaxID=28198 RepID=UPI0021B534A1|nr:N-6 DNA methylase [Aliarcobacter cryaerophilus]MCT7493565.1 N-6 DNA methylase [Aliarcobacter cryaerophilus]